MPSQDLIWQLMARMEYGFGRLEEGLTQNRAGAEMRHKETQKRIDRLEVKVDLHQQGQTRSSKGLWKALSIFLTHWQPAVMLALMALAFMGILKPDAAKKLMELAK